MIKLLTARYLCDFKMELTFSDGKEGVFIGRELLKRKGVLLDDLHDEAYFKRFFIDAGALSWPNGLELSPARLHEVCHVVEPA